MVVLALSSAGAPAFAQSTTPAAATATPDPRVAARAAAVVKATLQNSQRRWSDAQATLLPYKDDGDFDALSVYGQAVAGTRVIADCMRAVDIQTAAIALKPASTLGYERRASAYDCLGVPFRPQRLTDKLKAVELYEAASPLKQAPNGQYADAASWANDLANPPGQEAIDFERAKQALEFRNKAVQATNESTQSALRDRANRLMDRAELLTSRFNENGSARKDADEAIRIVREKLDTSGVDVANVYVRANINRRIAVMTNATQVIASTTFNGELIRPGIGSYLTEAKNFFDMYDQMFEAAYAANPDAAFVKFGNAFDTKVNRASTLNATGSATNTAPFKDAITDYQRAYDINPAKEPRRLGDIALRYVALNDNVAAVPFVRQYMAAVGNVNIEGRNGQFGALLANYGMAGQASPG